MQIYSIESLYGVEDWSIWEPKPTTVATAETPFWIPPTYWERIDEWVWHFWKYKAAGLGFDLEWLRIMAKRFYLLALLKNKHVLGYSAEDAFLVMKVNTRHLVSERNAGLGWVAIGLLAAAVLLLVFFEIVDPAPRPHVMLDFPKGACFLRYRENLWWGGVVAHPESWVWDIAWCYAIGPMTFMAHRDEGSGAGKRDTWDFLELWHYSEPAIVGWRVFYFSLANVRYRGLAHQRSANVWRLRTSPYKPEPWGYDVGWERDRRDACEYLAVLGELRR